MIKKHELVFVVQAYEAGQVAGQLNDVCVLELFAESEEKAIEKAKTLATKSFYRVSSIIEK